LGKFVLAVLSALIVAFSVPTAAFAAGTANCSESDVFNRWRGHFLEDSNQKHGVSGTAEAHTLAQCTMPELIEFSGSFIYSNIAPNNGGFNDIIQVGMGNCRALNCGTGMRYYSAWGRSGSTPGCTGYSDRAPSQSDEGAYVSAPHDFKVYHQTNAWRFFVDATQVRGLSEASLCWTPKVAAWFAETHDFGDQIGGTVGDKMSVTSMNYANTEGGGFFWTNWNAANACNYIGGAGPFSCDLTGTRSYDTWTDR
jgi:hypothetical protein